MQSIHKSIMPQQNTYLALIYRATTTTSTTVCTDDTQCYSMHYILKPHTILSTQFSLLFICWLSLIIIIIIIITALFGFLNHVFSCVKRARGRETEKHGQIRPCPEFCILFYGTMRFAYSFFFFSQLLLLFWFFVSLYCKDMLLSFSRSLSIVCIQSVKIKCAIRL